MLKKFAFVLLMSGVILSPKGTYAMGDDEGASKTIISTPYRLPVTELPSGDFVLPSGVKLAPTATPEDILSAMTLYDKIRGRDNKPLQSGATYVILSPLGSFSAGGTCLPSFLNLNLKSEVRRWW